MLLPAKGLFKICDKKGVRLLAWRRSDGDGRRKASAHHAGERPKGTGRNAACHPQHRRRDAGGERPLQISNDRALQVPVKGIGLAACRRGGGRRGGFGCCEHEGERGVEPRLSRQRGGLRRQFPRLRQRTVHGRLQRWRGNKFRYVPLTAKCQKVYNNHHADCKHGF